MFFMFIIEFRELLNLYFTVTFILRLYKVLRVKFYKGGHRET